MNETVHVGNPVNRQPAQPVQREEQERIRKAPVRLTRETKINFKNEATERHERPAKTRKELGRRWNVSKGRVTALLKEWGFNFNDYTWGLENAENNRRIAKDFWNRGKGAHYIRKVLEGLNVFMRYGAITQAIRKMNGVDAKIPDDIRQGTGMWHRGHNRDEPSTDVGGSGLRTGEVGEIMSAGMNINIRHVCFGLQYSEKQTLALYRAKLESGDRGTWLALNHRKMYGKKTFKEITMEFFPAIAAKFGFMEIK